VLTINRQVSVACCQLAPQLGRTSANRAAALAAIRAAAGAGAQIVVLPELATSGYVFADRAEAWELSETCAGPTVGEWAALAAELDLVIVGGLCERDGDRLFNTAVVIDTEGLRGVYRKAHLWDGEGLIFAMGAEPPLVLDTVYGRLGVMVCYDVEFPEWVRLAALDGAELLCLPTNWPRESRPASERPAEVVRIQAAASSNRMFIAACDRAGRERGVDWVNGTAIVGPDGYPLAGPEGREEPHTLIAHCDLARARDKRVSAHNDVLGDRRPELYGRLAE
jgi:predicted amidohydrolase